MKRLLIDYLLYGLFFVLLTVFAWGRRKYASSLLFVGMLLFWISFLVQVVGMVILYYLPPIYSYEMILYTVTIGGMFTSIIMMAHSFLAGKKKEEDDTD